MQLDLENLEEHEAYNIIQNYLPFIDEVLLPLFPEGYSLIQPLTISKLLGYDTPNNYTTNPLYQEVRGNWAYHESLGSTREPTKGGYKNYKLSYRSIFYILNHFSLFEKWDRSVEVLNIEEEKEIVSSHNDDSFFPDKLEKLLNIKSSLEKEKEILERKIYDVEKIILAYNKITAQIDYFLENYEE